MGGVEELTVEGLRNAGNVCYMNSAIQALASCNVFLRTLHSIQADFGINDAGDETQLSKALLELLTTLQPKHVGDVRGSGSSQHLLHLLRSNLGSDVLSPGVEHDAAEGLQLLFQALLSELTASFHSKVQRKLQAKAALHSLLHPHDPRPDVALLAWHALRLPCEGLSVNYMQCVRCRHSFTTQYTPFTILSMPLTIGPSISALGVCHVTPGCSLIPCFDAMFGYELVTGVECIGCSIRSSLAEHLSPLPAHPAVVPGSERVKTTAMADAVQGKKNENRSAVAAAGGQQHVRKGGEELVSSVSQSQKKDEAAAAAALELKHCVEERRPLPGEHSIVGTFQAAGVPFQRRKSQVTRRSMVARWPSLLVLHLRRTFWTPEGVLMKVLGHVTFPLRLALEARDNQRVTYHLTAVVEHSGLSAGTGHYVTFRSIGLKKKETQAEGGTSSHERAPAPGAAAPTGRGQQQQQQQQQDRQWVRVSDEDVRPVSEKEVLASAAVVLFYEMEQKLVPPPVVAATPGAGASPPPVGPRSPAAGSPRSPKRVGSRVRPGSLELRRKEA